MAEPDQKVGPNGQADGATQADGAADDLLEQLRRERADFLNYRRRVERERGEDRERAGADVITRLLPLLDELERALAQTPEDLAAHPWVQGVTLSRHRLLKALTELGVEPIGAVGEPFDPARHEALFYDARPDATDRRVAELIQPGYRLGDRLLRPARVGVVGPAERSEEPTEGATAKQPAGAPPRRAHDTQGGG